MSWHFSRALEGAFSLAESSAGELSVPLKSTGTDGLAYSPARTTGALSRSQFGTTSAPSTERNGGAVLTWFLEGFPVKPSPRRLEAARLRTISGRKCDGSWQMSLPGTFLPRTSSAAQSTPQPTTSSRWATKPAHFPYPRLTWVRTTFGGDIGYLHTPTATANYSAPSMQKWPNCRAFVKVFGQPTPEAHEYLMDWPIGWTALRPLATDRWQSWLRLHGVN